MNLNNARHEITAVKPQQYPDWEIPEIAFVGRSNVGKSSIINTLLNRKNLARVGSTPGKTRQINFFNIDDTLAFVDLPGYGYAKVSKKEKASWGELADTYLTTRDRLKLVIMLLDIRHTPTGDDRMMYEWIRASGLPHIIAATKSDKITRSQINVKINDLKRTLDLEKDVKVISFSSLKRQGIEETWDEIKEKAGIIE